MAFMAIYLPASAEEEQLALDELTPREIVAELDKHVVGQKDAKRAVAIALRNRMRRQKLTPELAEEIIPKNIIMIGPTGRRGSARRIYSPSAPTGMAFFRGRLLNCKTFLRRRRFFGVTSTNSSSA